jgi:hypothetical protein
MFPWLVEGWFVALSEGGNCFTLIFNPPYTGRDADESYA